jgi:hypothetical protein
LPQLVRCYFSQTISRIVQIWNASNLASISCNFFEALPKSVGIKIPPGCFVMSGNLTAVSGSLGEQLGGKADLSKG